MWVDFPNGMSAFFARAHAIVRAHSDGLNDLYLIDARVTPAGEYQTVAGVWNLTDTSNADESVPVVKGHRIAYAGSVDGAFNAVHTIDLDGVSDAESRDFSTIQRIQNAITRWQETGRTAGIAHVSYAFEMVARSVSLKINERDELEAIANGHKIRAGIADAEPIEGKDLVHVVPAYVAPPGALMTWAVDRVRAVPSFGVDRMQWVKAIAFTAIEWGRRARTALFGDDDANELREAMSTRNDAREIAITNPDIGWPPAAIEPIVTPPEPDEGAWRSLENDPFVGRNPGVPTPFVTTYIRAEAKRASASHVFVTMWDPRQVSLHMMAGTVEPKSATGEAGAGMVPHDRATIGRVVAGFNGGFQAEHGEYGMQAAGVMYLPPKPFAATVLELRDGSNAFGSWPKSPEIPDGIKSYRQNMTAIIDHGEFNPWGRTWWGGTPPGWRDTIYTTRSGICLTKDNFIGYFWGGDISAKELADAMLRVHCSFGMHLDMNPGLAGFEFYQIAPATELPPIGRPLDREWEEEATFRDMPDVRYRARRMLRSMVAVNFPTYLHRNARDFFYLTLRDVLPGSNLQASAGASQANAGATSLAGALGAAAQLGTAAADGVWQTRGLPQRGFPYAMAETSLPASHSRALRIDPRALSVGGPRSGELIAFPRLPAPVDGELGIWYHGDKFVVARVAPAVGDVLVAAGVTREHASAAVARRVMCVDRAGMLTVAELPRNSADSDSVARIDGMLSGAGCDLRLFVKGKAILVGGAPWGDARDAMARDYVRFGRGTTPSAKPFFQETPVVSPAIWQPLQSQRIRYFRKPKRVASETLDGVPRTLDGVP